MLQKHRQQHSNSSEISLSVFLLQHSNAAKPAEQHLAVSQAVLLQMTAADSVTTC